MAGFFELPGAAPLNKILKVITDRGFLIRGAVASAGVLLVLIGLVILLREPIGKTASTVAKAV